MLEKASQSIACDFDISQGLQNVPSKVISIATCDWALTLQKSHQSAHDGMFSYSPAMLIAAMVIRNIQLTIMGPISHETSLVAHHYAENR